MTSLSEIEVQTLAVDDLLLDWANPRLPADEHDRDRSQQELAKLMDQRYNPLAVARSIAAHGYFSSEPLIAIQEGERFRVLEGNRRLTALMGLRDPELRAELASENRGWARLGAATGPDSVPVLVVENEEDVDALLGFRHISGIDPWSPFQQAQFIARLIDHRGLDFEEASKVVGRPLTEVRSMYRDFDILRRARELGVDVKGARDQFGVFTLAMGRPTIRAFIGAVAPRDVDPDYEPFDTDNPGALSELMAFLFGGPDAPRVIRESRDVKDLVAVLDDESGAALSELRATRSLSEALAVLGGHYDATARSLGLANSSLRRALAAFGYPVSEQTLADLAETESLVKELREKAGK